MRLSKLSLTALLAGMSAAFMAAVGCGGTTSSSSSSLKLTYDLHGFAGTLISPLAKSSTPQTALISVNGTSRTVSNVIAATDLSAGTFVAVS